MLEYEHKSRSDPGWRAVAFWCTLSGLAAASIGAATWLLMGHYQTIEGRSVLDFTSRQRWYHLSLETAPSWLGTGLLAISLVVGLWRFKIRNVNGGLLAAFTAFHLLAWLSLMLLLVGFSEAAFP